MTGENVAATPADFQRAFKAADTAIWNEIAKAGDAGAQVSEAQARETDMRLESKFLALRPWMDPATAESARARAFAVSGRCGCQCILRHLLQEHALSLLIFLFRVLHDAMACFDFLFAPFVRVIGNCQRPMKSG